MRLDHLPPELIAHIGRFVDAEDRLAAGWSCSAVRNALAHTRRADLRDLLGSTVVEGDAWQAMLDLHVHLARTIDTDRITAKTLTHGAIMLQVWDRDSRIVGHYRAFKLVVCGARLCDYVIITPADVARHGVDALKWCPHVDP